MTIFKLPKWAESVAETKWNTVLVWVIRIVIGCVFMFSGFVKAIDPWGGMYKFTEYLQVYGYENLVPAALALAFGLAAIEFLLGVFILTGCFRRGSVVLLLAMMCVMLPLTLDLAINNRVPDCGCFGDAIVLSNWTSFWKNVFITICGIYLLLFNRRVHGIYGPAVNWAVGLISFIFIAAIAYNGYFKQPLLDFSKYRVGSQLAIPSAKEGSDEDFVFIYEKDGKQQEFSIDSLPDEDNGWTYVDRKYKAGKEPKGRVIEQTFTIYEDSADVTEEVLPDTGSVILYLFPDLKNVNISYSFSLNEINDHAKDQGMKTIALSSAPKEDVVWWKDISLMSYPLYYVDDSELKSIARGNPAVVMVKNGKMVWKRTLASIDNDLVRDAIVPIDKYNDDYDHRYVLTSLFSAYGLALLILLVINRTHVALMGFYHLFRRPMSEGDKDKTEETKDSIDALDDVFEDDKDDAPEPSTPTEEELKAAYGPREENDDDKSADK